MQNNLVENEFTKLWIPVSHYINAKEYMTFQQDGRIL